MIVNAQNLGPIKEAVVDLSKPLTVFCGGNNTGKTYLSYLIYALTSKQSLLDVNIPQEVAEKLYDKQPVNISIDPETVLKYESAISRDVKSNIDSVFGLSDDDSERLFSDLKVKVNDSIEECRKKIQNALFSYDITIGETRFKIEKEKKNEFVRVLPNNEINLARYSYEKYLLYNNVYHRFAIYPCVKSMILPVERNSIYTFNRELSISRNMLIDNLLKVKRNKEINPFELIEQGSKRYPLAIKNSIDIANDLSNLKKTKGVFFELATELENSLLNGTIDVSEEGDVVFFPQRIKTKKNGKLPIHISASLVKTLSSLIFYLKYRAEKNELILVDEPEMNLHPDSQVVLVNVLVRLMRAGLRILISTHSDYIIREINKYIMVGSVLSMKRSLPNGLNKDCALNSNDVAAYYFKPTPKSKKIIVDKLQVEEDGFSVPSIDVTLRKQNNEMQDLFYILKYDR